MSETRLKIAVFIDFDNIEIGVKTTLGGHFDVGAVLEAIKERGEVVTKIAYGDWTRAGDYSRSLTQHAIHMVQRNLTPGGDKNGADINLALDALEMAFTHSHINAFVIVGGDSDFMALVEKLKQYDRKVFVVGGRAFTSVILQKNCTEFIAYENLVSAPAPRRTTGGRTVGRAGETPALNAVPLIRRALKVLADREVSPQLGVLKSTLLQLDSTFSEREYGASTFRDFVQRLARAGYLTLKGTDRNIYVELKEGADGGAAAGGTGAASGASGSGTGGSGHAAASSGSGASHGAATGGKDGGEGYAADGGDTPLANVIEGDFGGSGAGSGTLHADAASGAGLDSDAGLSGVGGSLGEAAVDQGPTGSTGANGASAAGEAYASDASDGDDTDTVAVVPSTPPAPPARVWERVRDGDRSSEGRAEAGRSDSGRGHEGGRQPDGGGRGQSQPHGGGRRDTPGAGAPQGQGQGTEGVSGPAGSPPAALRFISEVFHRPGTVQRWPLYLRQVKQILRSVDESFDERRYGFTGIVEALRYCQREGLFRLDRDRQGVLRVYPGPVLQRVSTAAPQHAIDTDAPSAGATAAPIEDDDNRGNRIESGERVDRGDRGGRGDRGRGDRGDRGDRGGRDERGPRADRGDRPEHGEPLVPGTLELFPFTEGSDNETGAGAAASSGDGAHGPIADEATAVSPVDVASEAHTVSGDAAAGDAEAAPASKRKRGARGGRTAKKTAAKPSSKSGKSAAAPEKRAADKPAADKPANEKPAAEKSPAKSRAAKTTRARKAAKSSGA